MQRRRRHSVWLGEILVNLGSGCQNIFLTFTGYIGINNETLPYLTDHADTKRYDFGSACEFLLHSIVGERGS